MTKPSLLFSVIVVVHRMQREAVRTLYSLTSEYQRGVEAKQYEVIVVENPSTEMLNDESVARFCDNFRYIRAQEPSLTPATAINLGASAARGKFLTLLIDGARILSPGILKYSLLATSLHEEPIVAKLAWHLGPKNQADSIKDGYDQQKEDKLLAGTRWRDDGYRLFSIAALGGSSAGGWFAPLAESNCITVSRQMFDKLEGFSQDFKTPGGGFVNLDFYRRVVTMPGGQLFMLLGEGTFHQVHGGVATNRDNDRVLKSLAEEYKALRGQRFRVPKPASAPVYLGTLPEPAAKFIIPLARPRKRWGSLRFWKRGNRERTAGQPSSSTPEQVKSKILSVVGMHRSGTSCLAGTLMEYGVGFGKVSLRNRYNKRDNRENSNIVKACDSILRDNGGSWNNPPENVTWNRGQLTERDRIVAEYEDRGVATWGFKDPRTLFVLDGWLESLPEMRFVGTFRHPDCVVRSLLARDPTLFTESSAAELWYLYNMRLLAFARETNCKLVAFDSDDATLREPFELVATDFGLRTPRSGAAFFRSRLRHHAPTRESRYAKHVKQLYAALMDYSRECFDRSPGRSLAPAA